MEEAKVAPGQVDHEPPVEEAVGPLAGGLRRHRAAVAGGAVQEVLRVARRTRRADRVGRAALGSVQGRVDDLGEPGGFAELDQTAEGAVAVGGGRADQQPGRRFAGSAWRAQA